MSSEARRMLLTAGDPPPVEMLNPSGTSPFLLIGDHAGNRVPAALAGLGVPEVELARHIGWDIGVAGLGALMAEALDAAFVRQTYSRLVIDCNRDPARADAMPVVSDGTEIAGNRDLAAAERAMRINEIHAPYHAAIAATLADRDAAGRETILVALHSFTPRMGEMDRPWEIGVLHSTGDTRFARAMLSILQADGRFVVGDNEPYRMDDIDYTVPLHAFAAGRAYVELEVRQDLIASGEGQERWCAFLAACLAGARSG